ncbi:excinuclease ABC subunit C [Sphingomonas sp. Leaf23]|uniref:GIY-YIG nuclease family protein n=1 Tax=Sphingomonas sp. Leaf23 TaxID=1735689 RepID=UPI0006F56866|nr:GIY-YIG nuclease family protein [Sphingomonas sp. Leaf23]KQM85925.1 excinuclease ABC subunit C [Sphingomonas sp. Leaf23]
MAKERQGGWVYIMADRYRGATYVGVTTDLATRIHQHRTGSGSVHCTKYNLDRLVWAERGDDILACIAHEKRMKRWHRDWKFDLIERTNPDWRDLSATIIG